MHHLSTNKSKLNIARKGFLFWLKKKKKRLEKEEEMKEKNIFFILYDAVEYEQTLVK